MKTRREVLQGLIISIGGVSLLSACGGEATVSPSNPQTQVWRFYNQHEMALISRISDLLIPRTETPGALDVNVPGFLDGLMAEWASESTGSDHHDSLEELDRLIGGDFVSVSAQTAENTLRDFDSLAFQGGAAYLGYRSLKGLITQVYFASEPGALEELHWVASPGRWDPCIDLDTGSTV